MGTTNYTSSLNGKIQSAWAPWLLSIVTLGIYFLFWYYRINREMRDNGIPVNPGRAVLAIFPGGLIIVPAIVSSYNTGQRINALQQQRGLYPSASGWIGLLLNYVMSIGIIYYQAEINKAWQSAGGQPIATYSNNQISMPSTGSGIASATNVKPSAPAGWYPAPDGLSAQQYWDGAKWTEHRA